MRNTIEKSIVNFVYDAMYRGLFKAIQFILFGNAKNVCPRSCKW